MLRQRACMRILRSAPESCPQSVCPAPARCLARHFSRHRASHLRRESASGCRAAEDFGERREFAVLDDATDTTARQQSAEVRGLQLYPISRTGQRARGERRSNGRRTIWLEGFFAVGTLTGCPQRTRGHARKRASRRPAAADDAAEAAARALPTPPTYPRPDAPLAPAQKHV